MLNQLLYAGAVDVSYMDEDIMLPVSRCEEKAVHFIMERSNRWIQKGYSLNLPYDFTKIELIYFYPKTCKGGPKPQEDLQYLSAETTITETTI